MTSEAQKQLFAQALGAAGQADADGAMAALLKNALAKAELPPAQAALMDVLFSLHEEERATRARREVDDELDSGSTDPESDAEGPRDAGDDLRGLKRELADLREANDTMAAALGACRYCWGGDPQCLACDGRGRPGHLPPDPRLFAELVVPAVERMRAHRRSGHRTGPTRRQMGSSTSQKDGT